MRLAALLVAFGLVAVSGAGASVREACMTAEATRALVRDFAEAFNGGEHPDRFFAPVLCPVKKSPRYGLYRACYEGFQWYSIAARPRVASPGDRSGLAALRRFTLASYFAARHARGERFSRVEVRVGQIGSGWSNFELRLVRRANDLANGRPVRYIGKGAVWCGGERPPAIGVWSAGSGRSA